MNVPFVDLKRQYQAIRHEIDPAIQSVLDNTAFIGGAVVQNFAEKFAKVYGVKHCIPVANGTDAIYITLKMLGIGPGDEVITVANSWISTSETISQTGATPVFVDIEPDTYTISVADIKNKISNKTKAIIPVHLYGQMADMDAILALAEAQQIPVIEDCAQSHFSTLKGKRAGTLGIAGTFSFYPGKNLGAYGDAGCILTNDATLAENCKRYANHGALIKHQHSIEGINSRLDGLQAAVLSVKLDYILEWTEKRRAVAQSYYKQLADCKDIVLPSVRPDSEHSYHLFVIRCKTEENREALQQYLKEKGIGTALHYPHILPNLEAYQYLNTPKDSVAVANDYEGKILSIPMFPEITQEEIDYVCTSIKAFYTA